MTRNLRLYGAIVACTAAILLACWAGTNSPTSSAHSLKTAQAAATVSTDKADYLPGDTVTISGSGWEAGETVTLQIIESDGDVPWYSTGFADAAGNFTNTAFVIQGHDLGISFALTATGGSSGSVATANFTDGTGTGKVTVTSADGSCVTGSLPSGGGPFNWEIVEGGTYTMTINGVTECDGDAIKAFIQDSAAGNFCIILTKIGPGSYAGNFTVPTPACNTMPVSYKCDANGPCNNAGTFNARGPNGEDSVHLRANTFTNGCANHEVDTDCSSPTPTPTPTATPTPRKVCPIGCPDDVTVECGDSTEPEFTGTATSDGDCVVTHKDVLAPGDCPNTGVITRVWIATSADGTETVCTQKITIVDTKKPTITPAGADATIECPEQPVFTPPTGHDDCGDARIVEDSDVKVDGDCPGSYKETKTWHAEDGCGNKSDPVSQTITVKDTKAPTIGAPGANATIECPETPKFTPPTAKDDCGNAKVIEDSDVKTPGDCPNTYTEVKTWHAEDECGNKSAPVSQTIRVVDTTAPSIGEAGPNGTIECTGTPVFTAPTASDSCGSARVIEDSDVTTPQSCGYSRTKTWHAEDECGNKSGQKSQTIVVVDTQAPVIGEAGANATIYCPTAPVFTPPTASDDCGNATVFEVSDVKTPGDCGTYTETKTWQAKDSCGNLSAQKSQTLVVECNACGEGTMGFWQNKNGQALIKSANQANLSNFLIQFAPFQDLPPQVVATYVTNVIKAASASGASMNSMLKAQMLSTALNVYFGKVNGGAHIDLTHINKPIGSLLYENTQAAFGGGNCLTVLQLLQFAASQSSPGGVIWYGQNKPTQELAKDTFDAINNQVAFACP